MQQPVSYRVFEGLRVATCLTFISGYLNAFTFVTQGGRFAGIQSGNLISLAYYVARLDWQQVGNFSIPIIFFVLGQFFTYLAKNWFLKKQYPWHFGSSLIMLVLTSLVAVLAPFLPTLFPIACLAFVASIQVETFRSIRGVPYANVMMTGNIKNAAYLWFKGWMEKEKEVQQMGINILVTIIGFMLGVGLSTILSFKLSEYALFYVLLPLGYVTYQLWQEKRAS